MTQVIEVRDRRIGKGIVVAMSCEIKAFANMKETYKVQSSTNSDRYYICRFMDGTPVWCSCKDWEIQSQKNPLHLCKHLRAVVYADSYGLIKYEDEDEQEAFPKLEYERDDYTF